VPLDGNPAGAGLDATLAGAIGLPASGGALEVLVTPAAEEATFVLHDATGEATLGATHLAGSIALSATGTARPILWRVRMDEGTTQVAIGPGVGDVPLPMVGSLDALSTTSGWWRDPPYTWVRTDGDAGGVYCSLR